MPIWNPEPSLRASGNQGSVATTPSGFAAQLFLAVLVGLLPVAAQGTAPEAQLDIFGFTLRITDAEGQITHVLHGERMQQFDDLQQQHTEEPRLELLTDGELDWIWSAPAAIHYPARQRLELLGKTVGLRLPGTRNPQTEIETADVTILTDTREFLTDARATMIQPGLFMTGIGMHANVTTDIIELKSSVNTIYAAPEIEDTKP